jgi:hypothetical protein
VILETNKFCKLTLCSLLTARFWCNHTDEDITPLDIHNNPPMSIQGAITRARARQLNLEVSSFLSTSLFGFRNRLLSYDYVMIRNQGEDQKMHKKGLEVWWTSKGAQAEVEAQTKPTSGPFWSPGAVCAKTSLTVAYGLGFGRSLYVQKLKRNDGSNGSGLSPNSSGVVGNRQRKLTSRI